MISRSEELLDQKIHNYKVKLNEKWKNVILQRKAEKLSQEYKAIQTEIIEILSYFLNNKQDSIWDKLQDKSVFNQPHPEDEIHTTLSNLKPPIKEKLPLRKELNLISHKPIYKEPILTIFDYISPSLKKKTLEKANSIHQKEIEEWQKVNLPLQEKNKKIELDYTLKIKEIEEKYESEYKKYQSDKKSLIDNLPEEIEIWESHKKAYESKKESYSSQIFELKSKYLNSKKESIEKYNELVLKYSKYPSFIKKEYSVEYNEENQILIIEYLLPEIADFPKIIDVKYSNGIKTTNISNKGLMELFESTIYKITFRTILEAFKYDVISAINGIAFNGWINGIDKSNGKSEKKCIVSILVNKDKFSEINFDKVDLKTCFKALKGVSGAKIIDLTPINPVLRINKEDKRFVNNNTVTPNINHETNLAAMDWEDFEHLIREVFEKEFSINGGEVKVTQASKDGGVDAIAFDPDPIRGGKIVIQAKRYTNTVGVSSVRDLYGTVMNEGATKGILVTTADYGPDSYEFAKGKPLTLLNGSNLLYLLEKHGHKAKINIQEAKQILKNQ